MSEVKGMDIKMLEKKKKSVDTLQEETDLMEVLSKLLELEKENIK